MPLSRSRFFVALTVATTLATAAISAFAIAPGDTPPALPDNVLAAHKGKAIYVDFWASWCGPCKQSFPWMNAMQDKYGAKGLQVIAVNVDAKRADADRFLLKTPATFQIAYDPTGDSARRYAVKAMPTSLLIDRNGRVSYVHAGFRDEDRADLEAKINDALNKRP